MLLFVAVNPNATYVNINGKLNASTIDHNYCSLLCGHW